MAARRTVVGDMEGGALLKFLPPTRKWKMRHFSFVPDYSGAGDWVLQQAADEGGAISQELPLSDGFTVAKGTASAGGKPPTEFAFTVQVGAEEWLLAAKDEAALRVWITDLQSAGATLEPVAAAFIE